MNVQAHLSGQMSGQVPDQAGAMYVGLARQNGSSHHIQKQNIVGQRISAPDAARHFMQTKIYECLMQKQTQPHESARKNISDIARRLEDGLFKAASTMDEYTNLSTLWSRLQVLIQPRPTSMNNPQPSQFVNSSGPFGTMIPTPGMPHHGSSNLMASSSVDTSLIASGGSGNIFSPSVGSSGNLMQATNGSSSMTHGGSFHMSDGGNTISTTMGDQRVSSQMIPTPGFNSSNSNTFINAEAVCNGSGLSTADPLLASERILQKHSTPRQNSHMTQGFGNHMGNGMRSNIQQRSYASFQTVPNTGGLGSNVQSFTGSGSSESYSTTTATFGESLRPSQRQSEEQPRIVMQGDGGGLTTASDSSGPGNFSSASTSIAMVMSNQNMERGRLHPLPRSNLLMASQPNLQNTVSASQFRSQSSDQSENFSLRKSLQSRDHVLQPHQQYHRPSNQFPQQQPFLSHHGLQKQASMQDQGVLMNEILQRSSDISARVKAEPSMDHLNENFQPQVSGQFQFSELQTQFCKSSGESQLMMDRFSHLPSDTNGMRSTVPLSNPQQVLQPHQLVVQGQNQYDCLAPPGVQSHTSMQSPWHPDQEDRSSLPGSLLHEQKVREEFCQRLSGHDDAQCNNLPSSEGSISEQTIALRSAGGTLCSGGALGRSLNSSRERQFFYQIKWLLLLQHARYCKQPEEKCSEYCFAVRKLWKHMDVCNASHCIYPRCRDSKKLIHHNKHCRSPQCPVCVPVNSRLMAEQKKIRHIHRSSSALHSSVTGTSDATASEINVREASKPSSFVNTAEADSQPSLKRIKTELPLQAGVPVNGNIFASLNSSSESYNLVGLQPQELRNSGSNPVHVKSELLEVKMDATRSSAPVVLDLKKDSSEGPNCCMPGNSHTLNDDTSISKLENIKGEKGAFQVKQEAALQSSDQDVGTKSGKPKIKGVSLTELFTPEQVRSHIRGLRQWVGQSKAKAEKNQAMERSMSENSCQLCAVEKLTFDPPPIYCTRCNFRIKRNAFYYTVGAGDTCHYICVTCFSGGDTVSIDGSAIPKSRFEKKKNDEETEEWWVQCDKCEAWQHQICALFNGRRNDGGQADYTCPNCYIEEVESGERKPLPQSAVLGAKDLPGTILSDHIEQRLFKKLKEERHERALKEGKSYDEVPGAEGLVVRVVSSVDKKLEVKPRFLEIFREENYPTEFAYKSKVVLLFQKIEGVEVCLFGMYVQEFGSECPPPNQRRVYLSYLDSVKYFRPEVRAVNGEALRTFVYHQILIGYLEYCKERGFTSCYIWACPPAKGEDYILYCHPEIQKTPKSDKLREWYLSMLKKATEEKIVVELTNFYDHFFVNNGECKAKITASRLPYFEGDYWPGAAEETIEQLSKEEEGRKQNKKGTTKKLFTKRTLKASGQLDLSSNASKDLLLMHRLGETILPMKEDFIMVHLQYSCTHCCVLMVSGHRWVCKQCRSFQICHTCYDLEQKLEERERHPVSHREKHTLYRVEIKCLPEDTKDKDDILESEFFDTRQAFLSLCQGNHYQYDTLRRAKHSSMMVLYHLHNPTAPAFVTTCNICHLDIETGQGWRCETCPEYDVCNSCYQREGGIDHPHKLTNHPSLGDRDAQNKEARQLRVLQLRKMLDLLVHASQCRSPHCQYPNCRKVKGLFRHGIQCKTRASGGCVLCKKMWYLLQLHARACKESQCHVPRCRDLKDHLRRLQQQSDSRRRAAVMEMMRQRAAEVAGSSS